MARPEVTKTALGQRLRDVRKALGDPDRDLIAAKVGVSKNTIAHYERGDRVPDATALGAYRREFGIDANWVLTGDGEMFGESIGSALAVEGFVTIERLDISASAGGGAMVVHEDAVGLMAFDAGWLRRKGINPGFANVLTAAGDSMEPTIRDGDVLLVDRSIDRIVDNGIYVAVVAGLVVVKRVQVKMDGTLVLQSDNQFYDREEFGPDRVDELVIAGRVMWFGRSI